MKKLLCAVSLQLIAALFCSASAAAQDSVYAAVTENDGEITVLSEAPDKNEIDGLDGYELLIGGEPVLTVEQTDTPALTSGSVTGNTFSAGFDLPDTTKTVFLTGLTSGMVGEIQERIIAAYALGKDFSLTDLSFIDAEKAAQSANLGDSNLCWAASAANILTYTGWAAQANAGFAAEDDVFEAFIAAFSDSGGSAQNGFGWFFNGVNLLAMKSGDAASPTAGTGGYLRDYPFELFSDTVSFSKKGSGALSELYARLRSGCGAALGLNIYNKGTYAGGHAVSCWGYVADTAYSDSEQEYYAGVFISDSDSDKNYNERRDAPNILQYCGIEHRSYTDGSPYFGIRLDSRNYGIMDDFAWLVPYSPELGKETSSDATRDKVNTPDLYLWKAYLGTGSPQDYESRAEKIESNTDFYYTPVVKNESEKRYYNSTRFVVTAADSDGNRTVLWNYTMTMSLRPNYYTDFETQLVKKGGLPEGDYTVTMSVNDTHTAAEAYYCNNSFSFPLKVRDSYLLGDTDNSGYVDVMDATKIQRCLAGYNVGENEKMRQRGALGARTRFDIMDATQIQRYLAGYSTRYGIGEKRLYD